MRRPGVSEAELAGLAAAAMFREAGRRVPAILTVSTGAEATATGGGVATERVVQQGDLGPHRHVALDRRCLVGHRECGVRG